VAAPRPAPSRPLSMTAPLMQTSQPTPTTNETGRQSPRAPSPSPRNWLSEPVSRRLPATRALPPPARVVLLLGAAPAAAAGADLRCSCSQHRAPMMPLNAMSGSRRLHPSSLRGAGIIRGPSRRAALESLRPTRHIRVCTMPPLIWRYCKIFFTESAARGLIDVIDVIDVA
jgi:hypothetical protein